MGTLFEDKGLLIPNNRQPEYNTDPIFIHRWSPRAFDPTPIPKDVLMSIFEAARWSMSCYNDQPWLFMVAVEEEDLKLYRSLLVEWNQKWARKAPVLGFIFAKKRFDRNDKPNDWAQFDTGAAWMAMSLQARILGLYTHGMAGFDREGIYDALGVSKDDYTALAAFTIGRYGDPEKLPEDMKKTESPNARKPLSEILVFGKKK